MNFKNIFDNNELWLRLTNTVFSINLQIFSLFVGTVMIFKELDSPVNDFRSLEILSLKTEIPTASYIFILVVITNFGIVFGAKFLDLWIRNKYKDQYKTSNTGNIEQPTQPLLEQTDFDYSGKGK